MPDQKDSPKSLSDVLGLLQGSQKKTDSAAAGKGGPEALAGAQKDLASAQGALGGLLKNKDKAGGLLDKALGVRDQVGGAKDQIGGAKDSVGGVQKGQTGASVGLPDADKLIKSATDKLAPPADDAAAGLLKGFKVPDKLPLADANVAKAEKIVEGLNKQMAAKGALPPKPDALGLSALQKTLAGAQGQAAAVAAPAGDAAKALPKAQTPITAAQQSIAALMAGPGAAVADLEKSVPQIKDPLGDIQGGAAGAAAPPAATPAAPPAPAVPAGADATKAVPKADLSLGGAQASMSAVMAGPGATVADLQKSLPQIKDLVDGAQKLVPDPKALTDLAGKIPDVTAMTGDAKKGADDLSKAPGPTAAGLKSTGTLPAAQAYIESALGKLPDGAKALTDAAKKIPDLLSPLGAAKGVMDSNQPLPDAAKDPERLDVDAVEKSVADAAAGASSAADAAGSANDALPGAGKAIDDAQKAAAAIDTGGASPQALQAATLAAHKQATQLASAVGDASSATDPITVNLTAAQGKLDDLKKAVGATDADPTAAAASALDAAQKQLDDMTKSAAPADQVAAAQSKVQDLTKQLDAAKQGSPVGADSAAEAAAQTAAAANVDALSKQTDAMQKAVDVLTSGGAPASQIAAAQARMDDLTKQLEAAKAAGPDALAAAQKDLDDLKKSGAPADQIKAAEAKVADLTKQKAAASSGAAGTDPKAAAEVDAASKQLEAAQKELDALKKAGASADKIKAAEAKVADLTKQVDAAKQKAGAVPKADAGADAVAKQLAAAQKDLDDLKKSSAPADKIAAAEARVAGLQTQLDAAKKKQDDRTKPAAAPAAPKPSDATVAAAKQLDTAQKELDALKKSGAPADKTTAAEAKVAAAQKQLDDAKKADAKAAPLTTKEALQRDDLVPKVDKLVSDAKQQLTAGTKAAAAASEKMAGVTDPLKKANEELASVKPDSTQSDLDKLQAQLKQAQAGAKEVSDGVQKAAGGLADTQKHVDAGTKAKEPEAVKGSVDKAVAGAAAVAGVVSDAAKKISGIQAQIAEAQKALDSAKKGSGPTADALAQKGTVEKIQALVTDLSQKLADAQKTVASAKDKTAGLSDLVAKAKAATDQVKDSAAAKTSMDAAKAKLADLQQKLPNVGKALTDSAKAVPGAQDQIKKAQQIIADISSGKIAGDKAADTLKQLKDLVDASLSHLDGAAAGIDPDSPSSPGGVQALIDELHGLTQGVDPGAMVDDAKKKIADLAKFVDQAKSLNSTAAQSAKDAFAKLPDLKSIATQLQKSVGDLAKGGDATIQQSMDAVAQAQAKLADLQKGLPGVSDLLAQAAKAAPGAQQAFDEVQKTLADIQSGKILPAAAQQSLDRLKSLFASAGGGLSGLPSASDTAALSQHVADAKKLLAGVVAGSLSADAKDKIDGLSKFIDSSTKQLADLASGAGGASNLLKPIQDQFAKAQETFNSIVGQAGAIAGAATDAVAKAQQAAQQLQQQLPNVAGLLSTAAGAFPSGASRLNQVKDLFDAVVQGSLSNAEIPGALAELQSLTAGAAQQFLASQMPGAADALAAMKDHLSQGMAVFDSLAAGELPSEAQALVGNLKDSFTKAQQQFGGLFDSGGGAAGSLSGILGHVQQAQSLVDKIAKAGLSAADIKYQLASSPEIQNALAQAQQISSTVGGLISQAQAAASTVQNGIQQAQQFASQASKLVGDLQSGKLSPADALKQLASSPQLQSVISQVQSQFPEAAKMIAQASSIAGQVQDGVKQAQALASQASQMVSDLQSGKLSPADALKQISTSPLVQNLLSQAEAQFPQVAALVSQASDIAGKVQDGLAQAQKLSASLQAGDFAGAAQQLASIPIVQGLLGDAAKQFPEAAALIGQATALLPDIQNSLGQAGAILGDFQSGNYQAALQQLGNLPLVKDLLGAAATQFPEAAALIGQAQGAFAAAQQGLAQADALLTAFQSGNYADVAAQLSALPVVQDLLAMAQKDFPEAAALLTMASQYLPEAEQLLGQAQNLLTAFQQGTLTPDMLMQLPIAQALLGDAQGMLTDFLQANAPEALQAAMAAAAMIPDIQAQIANAQGLLAAAQAGDITAVAAALGVGDQLAAAQAAVASISATAEQALADAGAAVAAVEAGGVAAEAAAAVVVGASDDATAGAEADATGAVDLLLDITTPLGDGKLEILTIDGEETMSGLFFYKVVCTSEESAIDFTQIVGQSVTVTFDIDDDIKRYVNGICTKIIQGPQDAENNTTYHLELRPWFFNLTLAQDCQIFQAKSVIDIITGIFDALGFSDYTNSTTGTYTARDYCVQYRETTFDFISRLMEDEGISYFFKHEDGKHTLILADDSDVHVAVTGYTEVEYDPSEGADTGTIAYITLEGALTTTQYMMDDFNFETSDTDLKVTVDGTGMKIYEYPGGYTATDAGTTRAGNHLAAYEMPAKILRGRSKVPTFSAGYKFTLTEHERDDVNADYVLSKVTLNCTQTNYKDEFEAFPATTVFRPPLKTRKPVIAGAQTALVVGKSGEEIWTDQYGRIKVQFYWDQVGVKDENSSCWIRVAQGWAGKSWGMVFLPRMGQEVIVSFLEGDPDRPIVTGCVYNAQNTVPYTLPDDQTKSTIKSISSKSGTLGNEIRFQDLKDSEELYMYATKDMNVRVVNNLVGGVKNSYQMYIQSDDPTVDTDNKYVLSVDGGGATTTIKGDANEEKHTNEGKFTHTVGKEFSLTVNGDTMTITTTGDLTIQGKSVTIKSTSGDVTITSGANLTASSAQSLTNKSGTDFTNQAGTTLTNKSGTDLTNQAGTSLSNTAATSMTNDGGLSLTNKASGSQTVDGGGMLTLKGGMVKIN